MHAICIQRQVTFAIKLLILNYNQCWEDEAFNFVKSIRFGEIWIFIYYVMWNMMLNKDFSNEIYVFPAFSLDVYHHWL